MYRWSTIQNWTLKLHQDLYSSSSWPDGQLLRTLQKKIPLQILQSSCSSGPSPEEFCPVCFVRETTLHTKVSRLAWNGCSEKTVHRWASVFKIHDRHKREAPSFNAIAVGTTTPVTSTLLPLTTLAKPASHFWLVYTHSGGAVFQN